MADNHADPPAPAFRPSLAYVYLSTVAHARPCPLPSISPATHQFCLHHDVLFIPGNGQVAIVLFEVLPQPQQPGLLLLVRCLWGRTEPTQPNASDVVRPTSHWSAREQWICGKCVQSVMAIHAA